MKKSFIPILFIVLIFSSISYSQFQLENAFPSLTFSSPVGIYPPGDGTDRLFVVEQQGIIKVFENNRNTANAKTFLNITDIVTSGGETGLLGLAFHPDYANNGYFYVDYTAPNPLRTVIARFQVSSANPDSAVKSSELILLEIDQPYSNHNGGQIVFGPDGYLYIGMGDGGSGGDPQDNAQNLQVLLGKILRIDVDNPEGGMNYGIPPDNPFVNNNQGYREEIYTYGMRNPWRFSFDPVDGKLWCGDVGQNLYEEIDIIQNGKNYGWRCYEGFHSYNLSGCNAPEYTFPVWEYSHSGSNCSITGGYVYRGMRRPELTGKYIYGDYCSRNIWQFRLADSSNSQIQNASASILSFGVDMNHELYICTSDSKIYQFVPVLNAPSNLTASNAGSGQIELSWNSNSTNFSGFKIERKDSSNIFTLIDSVDAGTTTYIDNVNSASNYTYRVIAYDDSSVSNYSNEASLIITDVPVELTSFTANVGKHSVILNWTTATEKNNKGFEIERFLNNNWAKIGFIEGNGTTTEKNSYSFTDDFENHGFNGLVKYRIKQIDYNGSFSYSNTISLNLNFKELNYNLEQNYPNPFNPSTKITYNIPETSNVHILILNVLGKVVSDFVSENEQAGQYEKTWDASNYASGVYYVRMSAKSLVSGRSYFKAMKMLYLK